MIEFSKYHALGNDYLIIDPRRSSFDPTPDNVRLVCDRRFGIGADGLIIGPEAAVVAGEPIRVSIFNSDGSPCDRSANGIRMVVHHLAHTDGLSAIIAGQPVEVRTAAGPSTVDILDHATGRVRINVGPVTFVGDSRGTSDAPARIWHLDVDGDTFPVISLHNGNPHIVVRTAAATGDLALRWGEPIAGHPRWPDRVNVQFLQVIDRSTIAIEIWERGAGYTLASGSSACAATSAAYALGLVDRVVTVRMPGGEVVVSSEANGDVTLAGTVSPIATGSFTTAFRSALSPSDRVLAEVAR